jgi:tRNA-Thr(GGU) m(6)t(6)A37 methyltransferase TsaA
MGTTPLLLEPIGIIRTPHRLRYATPRQPSSAREASIGIIRLKEGKNFDQALDDLEGFDYIWILFWFHRNASWKPKVLPPHGDRKKRGLFATRSPHRPNPIGLSLCRLLQVRGRTLKVENPDMLDGTPILDIKPYLPHAESQPQARAGWLGGSNELSEPSYRVVMHPDLRGTLERLPPRERTELETYLTGLLSRDPYPHPYRRITLLADGSSELAVRKWRFIFSTDGDTVTLLRARRVRERRASDG